MLASAWVGSLAGGLDCGHVDSCRYSVTRQYVVPIEAAYLPLPEYITRVTVLVLSKLKK